MRSSQEQPSLTAFIHGLTLADIPTEVLQMARRCCLDTLGVWIAGYDTPVSQIVRDHVARRMLGALSLPFDERTVSAAGFAFAGAASIDAIDGHDGHQLTKGHASVAVLPAVLAECAGVPHPDLEEMLLRFIIGSEIAIRAGLALHASVPDYHSSGAWNGLGCAAVAARARKLSPEATRHALGIAEYFGPRAQMMRCIDHPSMVKDSSSWGAFVGINAADLAQDGFTGSPALTCEAEEVAELWHDLGRNWRVLETNFKAYPVCRWAQPPIEAVLSLIHETRLEIGDITRIDIATFHEATRLATKRPKDGDQAQYSLPISVALALTHGALWPEHLRPGVYDAPDVLALVDRIEMRETPEYNAAFPAQRFADVTLELRDGRRLQSQAAEARGNFDAPLPDDELIAKFHRYAKGRLGAAERDRLESLLSAPATAPGPEEILSLLTGGGGM